MMNKHHTDYNTMLTQYPDVLTVQDIQEILRINKTTAYELLHSDAISYRKIGRIYRISKQSLIDFINA